MGRGVGGRGVPNPRRGLAALSVASVEVINLHNDHVAGR